VFVFPLFLYVEVSTKKKPLNKKFAEIFIRNIFIFAALFFGEKYMIEHLTKKVVDSFIFNSNKLVGWTTLNYT